MANRKHSNTISSCAYSLGVSEDFLADVLEQLKDASARHSEIVKNGGEPYSFITVYNKLLISKCIDALEEKTK